VRELWENKARSVLVVLSIAVGVFAVGLVAGARAILAREIPAGYLATDPASAVLFTSSFDDDLVRAVRHMPEVQEAEGRRSVTVRLETGPGEWRNLYITAVPDYNTIRINRLEPESGAWPPPRHELLIERAALGLTNAAVGDVVVVKTPGEIRRELRIAGLVHDQSRLPATFEGMPYGYVTFETLEWLGQPRDYNELYITVAQNTRDREYIRRVAERVRDRVERSGRAVSSVSVPDPGKPPLNDEVQAIVLLLGVLGFMSLVLSGFLVVNTMSALLTQQVRQVGMMKAIGARAYQVAGMYLGMALIFGLLAVTLGAPLGVLGARVASVFAASMINSDVANLSVPPSVLALEAFIGLLVPLLAAFHPVIAGTRAPVHEALSDYGLGKGRFGTTLVDRLIERIRGLPRPLLLSLRNTFRRKGRLALTLSTLTLGSALFIAITSVYASSVITVDDIFRYWRYDVQFMLARPYRIELLEREAKSVPGVVKAEHYSVIRTSRVHADKSEGEPIILYAVPAQAFSLQPDVIDGRWLLPEDKQAIVISNKFLDEEPGVKVGDQIVLKINGKETTWHVVGTVYMLMADGPTVYVNYPYYARVVGNVGCADGVYVATAQHDPEFQKRVASALEQHFESLGLNVTAMSPISNVRSSIEAMLASIIALLLLMAILVILVGGLGLTGIMSLNVLERTREIGVMRAIGASGGAVRQIVLAEGILIGVISWFLGGLLALPLSKMLSDAVGMALIQTPFSYAFSRGGALLWLILVIALGALASLWPARRASRLTVREVLAYE
jgi:putative ABC transport system permease protein